MWQASSSAPCSQATAGRPGPMLYLQVPTSLKELITGDHAGSYRGASFERSTKCGGKVTSSTKVFWRLVFSILMLPYHLVRTLMRPLTTFHCYCLFTQLTPLLSCELPKGRDCALFTPGHLSQSPAVRRWSPQWVLTGWGWANVRRNTTSLGTNFDQRPGSEWEKPCGGGQTVGGKCQDPTRIQPILSFLSPRASPIHQSSVQSLEGFQFGFYHRDYFPFKTGGVWQVERENYAFHCVTAKLLQP